MKRNEFDILVEKMRSLGTADTSRSFSFIEPMKALPVEKLPEGDWLYEGLKPVLVAPRSSLPQWTHDDQLRQPVFLGLRGDKEAAKIIREPAQIPMKINERNAAALSRYADLLGLTPEEFLNKFLEDFLLAQFEDLFSGTAESYLSDFSFKDRVKAEQLAAWMHDRFKKNDPKTKFEIEVIESMEGEFRVRAATFSHGRMYQI